MIRSPEAETALLTTSNGFPVAVCPGWQVAYDKLQWILQHWRAPRWRDRAFCRTRAGLELSIREQVGREHQAAIAHLPDWHPSVAAVPEPKWYRHGASMRLDLGLRGSTIARGENICEPRAVDSPPECVTHYLLPILVSRQPCAGSRAVRQIKVMGV